MAGGTGAKKKRDARTCESGAVPAVCHGNGNPPPSIALQTAEIQDEALGTDGRMQRLASADHSIGGGGLGSVAAQGPPTRPLCNAPGCGGWGPLCIAGDTRCRGCFGVWARAWARLRGGCAEDQATGRRRAGAWDRGRSVCAKG